METVGARRRIMEAAKQYANKTKSTARMMAVYRWGEHGMGPYSTQDPKTLNPPSPGLKDEKMLGVDCKVNEESSIRCNAGSRRICKIDSPTHTGTLRFPHAQAVNHNATGVLKLKCVSPI